MMPRCFIDSKVAMNDVRWTPNSEYKSRCRHVTLMFVPFVCIEPWFNTTDSVDASGKFEDKENIIKLEPNNEFNCEYSVEFF